MPHPPRIPAVTPLINPLLNKAADLQIAALAKVTDVVGKSYAEVQKSGLPDAVRSAATTGAKGAVALASALLESRPGTKAAAPSKEAADSRATSTEGAAQLHPDELPIANFDELTVASVRARVTKLDLAQLRTLRAYEAEHGNRAPVLTTLDNRIAKLKAGSGA